MSKQLKAPLLERNIYLRYLFSKHCVTPEKQATSFDDVVNAVVGVHSARLPSPYVAFHSRMKHFKPSDFRLATYKRNHLIKLRCMRKTLHTVTQELAPIVHLATLQLRVGELESTLRRVGFPFRKAQALISQIAEVAAETPLSHTKFLEWIAQRVSRIKAACEHKTALSLARVLLRSAWEQGHICYLNNAGHWSREVRFYGNTRLLYPKISFETMTRQQAVCELVARYIRAFEPVSIGDIAWWSGIRITEVRKALDQLGSDLMRVDLEGVSKDLLMTNEGFANYVRFQFEDDDSQWCAFLAYEDPTLKGYSDTRARYVADDHYERLFNSIGEARPSVLLNGRVAGVWSWNAKTRKISVEWFRPLTKTERSIASVKRQNLEAFLDESSPQDAARVES